jgi:hypothetical protein
MRLHPGEVEATGWEVTTLFDLVQRLLDASPGVTGRPRVIAIDGRGGAGKSVLASRLQELVPASAVVHTDDIAWNQAYFDWAGLLVDGVLRPLAAGGAVDFQPPAWSQHGRCGVISVPVGLEVVWVEGTGVIRGELAPWIDASMYLQGDLDEQERRLVARDGASTAMQEHIAAWLAEELPFMLREEPWQQATVVVSSTPALDHDQATEIVVATRPT